ncbi:MAG: hypothetical protein ACOC1P_01480 [Minisyncoccales bacterium]
MENKNFLKGFFIILKSFFKKENKSVKLKKSSSNPIISPRPEKDWESRQTFNTASIYLDGKIHFLYRAIGKQGFSVLGYAVSKDGINIEDRLDKAAYTLKRKQNNTKTNSKFSLDYSSGGSVEGCEDPRLTKIGDRIYMTYTTFNGWSLLRVTLTSISKEDFLTKNWEKWEDPVFISPPEEINKNWVIFPEKINGKYAILHSISPKILIEYVDDLDFNEDEYLSSHYSPSKVEDGWEGLVKGVGPPPIKTEYGWLVLYHAFDKKDQSRYKIGAMILDYSNPEKILYRAKEPILEPDSYYENNGFKPGIIYSCGANVIDERLFVYYGGADSVICAATIKLDKSLNSLTQAKIKKLKFKLFKNIFKQHGISKTF